MFDLSKKVKNDFIRIDGVEYEIKSLRPHKRHEANEALKMIMSMPVTTLKEEEEMMVKAREYLMMVIDLPEDIAEQLEYEHFEAIQGYLNKKPYLDQGMSEKEIERINKQMVMAMMEGKDPMAVVNNIKR